MTDIMHMTTAELAAAVLERGPGEHEDALLTRDSRAMDLRIEWQRQAIADQDRAMVSTGGDWFNSITPKPSAAQTAAHERYLARVRQLAVG